MLDVSDKLVVETRGLWEIGWWVALDELVLVLY